MKIGRGIGPTSPAGPQTGDSTGIPNAGPEVGDSIEAAKSGIPLKISGSAIILSPKEGDSVNISQTGERLLVQVNDQELMLSTQESGMLELRGNLKGVSIDPSVRIPIKGVSLTEPEGKTSKGNSSLATARQNEASLSAGITQRLLISELKEKAPAASPQQTAPAGSPSGESSTGASAQPKQLLLPDTEIPGTTGLSQQGQQLSQNVTEGNPEGILRLIGDGTPAELLPADQKRSAIQLLKDGISSSTSLPHADQGRDAIFRVLSSAQNGEEFKSMLSGDHSANGLGLMSMTKELAGDGMSARSAMRAASLDMAAGALGMSDMALNPERAAMGESAVKLGFTPAEILGARRDLVLANTGEGWTTRDVLRFASDPLSMAVASPEEKTSMLGTLRQGHLSLPDQTAALSILKSAGSPDVFEMLATSEPSKDLLPRLSHPDISRSFSLLASGFGMPELTTDGAFVPGMISHGVLSNQEAFDRLISMREPGSDLPMLPNAGEIISSPLATGSYLARRMEAWAVSPEPGSLISVALENALREGEGMPLLNPVMIRSELIRAIGLEGIASPDSAMSAMEGETQMKPGLLRFDPSALTDLIPMIAGREGISEFLVQQIAVAPFAAMVGRLSDQVLILHAAADMRMESSAKRTALQTGIDSRAFGLISDELSALRVMSQDVRQQLSEVGSVLGRLLSKESDPVDIVFRTLESAPLKESGLATILPDRLPFPEAISQLPSREVLPALETLARLTTQGSDLNHVVSGTAESIRLPDALRSLPTAFQRLERQDVGTMDTGLRSFVEQGKLFAQSVLNGSYSAVLHELQGALGLSEDSSVRSSLALIRHGISFLNSMGHGSWKALFSVFGRNLVSFSSEPPTRKISGPWTFSNIVQIMAHASNPMETLTREFPDWSHKELAQSFKEFRSAAVRFADTHSFHQAAEAVRSAKEFVSQLRTGNLTKMLSPLKQMAADSPIVQDILQRAIHLSTIGASFLQPLFSRDWEKPLEQSIKKNQSSKGLREAEGIFNSTIQSFYPITSVDYLDSLWRYQKSFDVVRDETFVSSMTDRYRNLVANA